MSSHLPTYLSYGYCALLLIISFIGALRYHQLTIPFKLLLWSVITAFLLAVASIVTSRIYKTNAPVLHLEAISQYVFYSLVFYKLFHNKAIKKFIFISIIAICVFFPLNAIFLQPFYKKFATNINIPAQILYAVFSLLLYREMLNYPLKLNIIKQGIFWFNTAMLFFALTMFFFLGISNYIAARKEDKIVTDLWFVLLYIFQVLIGVALVTDKKENNTEFL